LENAHAKSYAFFSSAKETKTLMLVVLSADLLFTIFKNRGLRFVCNFTCAVIATSGLESALPLHQLQGGPQGRRVPFGHPYP
jgi:hypothetical protein